MRFKEKNTLLDQPILTKKEDAIKKDRSFNSRYDDKSDCFIVEGMQSDFVYLRTSSKREADKMVLDLIAKKKPLKETKEEPVKLTQEDKVELEQIKELLKIQQLLKDLRDYVSSTVSMPLVKHTVLSSLKTIYKKVKSVTESEKNEA